MKNEKGFIVFSWAVDWYRDNDCDSNCHHQGGAIQSYLTNPSVVTVNEW